MVTESHLRLLASFRSFCRVASITVILLGCLVLFGWVWDITMLKGVLPGLVTMKVNTALAFILAGLSLHLQVIDKPNQSTRALARGCALLVTLIGMLTLSQDLFGWDLGIDDLLYQEAAGTVQTSKPGRMAPFTALCFFLSGIALLLLDAKVRQGHRLAQALILGAALISFLTLLGYGYGVQSLYGIEPYSSMALHTALAFILLSSGILCSRPDRGLMAIVTSEDLGGVMVRRLLLPALLIPLILGWLRLAGERAELYAREFGVSLMVLLGTTIFSGLILMSARSLQRIDLERGRIADALRESEERFRATFEQAAVGIAHVAPDGRWLLVNQRFCAIVGYMPAELLERTFQDITHPDDLQADVECVRQMLANELQSYSLEKRYIRKDGSCVWINLTVSLVREPAGEPKYFIAVIEDITARRRAEEEVRRLNQLLEHRVIQRTAELEAANKELEGFSYSVSHDLRAPLRAIAGFSQILSQEYAAQLPNEAQHYLNLVQDSAKRMDKLINDLLAFSRLNRQALSRRPVDPADLVRQALEELRSEQEGRRLDIRIGELPECQADPSLLKQVFINLLSNALKFTRHRELAVIEIGCQAHQDTPVYFVRDNGVGFDMRYAHKLFAVFQRLHRAEDYEGTGVGLALVRRIINRHGGRVWAEAQVDQGATFYFTLSPKEISS